MSDAPENDPEAPAREAMCKRLKRELSYPGKREPCTENMQDELTIAILSFLPGSTTIHDASDIVMDVVERIDAEWDRHEKEHGK